MKISALKSICWYPSAGYDFEAIYYWSNEALRTIKPKVFIYTDYNYQFSDTLFHGPPKWKRIADLLKTFFKHSESIEIDAELKEVMCSQFNCRKLNVELKEMKGHWGGNQIETKRILCIRWNQIQLLIINCKNEEFYNYCRINRVKIEGIMLHRPMDRFITDNEELIIKGLNIQEGIGSSPYMQYKREEIKEYEFLWETVYGHNNDRIAKIRYIDIFH